jgi:hypothetical protein
MSLPSTMSDNDGSTSANYALSRILEDIETNITTAVLMLFNVTPKTKKSALACLSCVQTDITKAVGLGSATSAVSGIPVR